MRVQEGPERVASRLAQAAHSIARGGDPGSSPSPPWLTVPPFLQLCEDLFSRINDTTNDNMSYSVEVGPPRLLLAPGAGLGIRCGWQCFSDAK